MGRLFERSRTIQKSSGATSCHRCTRTAPSFLDNLDNRSDNRREHRITHDETHTLRTHPNRVRGLSACEFVRGGESYVAEGEYSCRERTAVLVRQRKGQS